MSTQTSNLKSKASNLKLKVSNLKSKVSNLKPKVSNLKPKVATPFATDRAHVRGGVVQRCRAATQRAGRCRPCQ
ncbi:MULTISPECIES: hypothetical protein [unclassified Janthinobacterium]|uniref:hypothetical protein n=1 Tax=unclassified Janthinobacterium TaxID=2610881 RepID=UPI00111338AC|nr:MULTISPECIES: hypothetical protein [unclassified Janthinobacterium]